MLKTVKQYASDGSKNYIWNMKLMAGILLFVFCLLTVQPVVSMVTPVQAEQTDLCAKSCCTPHEQQKQAPKPMKGMCGEISCNPFGQYACCTGYVVSDKSQLTFMVKQLQEYPVEYSQTYIYHFSGNCWTSHLKIVLVF